MPRAGQEKRTTYRDYRRALIGARVPPREPRTGRSFALAICLTLLGVGIFIGSVAFSEEVDPDPSFWSDATQCPAEVVDVWETVKPSFTPGSDTHHWTYYLDVPCVETPGASPIASPETLHSDESPLGLGDQVTAANYDGVWYIVELLEQGHQPAPMNDGPFFLGLVGLAVALAGVAGIVLNALEALARNSSGYRNNARTAGRMGGELVREGELTPEYVALDWEKLVEKYGAQGDAFLQGYQSTGAPMWTSTGGNALHSEPAEG